MSQLPRIPLVQKPTPLHRLDRASQELGIDLWIKRDDLTGLALGGNKGRKLEYLMADAQLRGAEVVVTCGSSQSNFIRQLAAACAMLQMKCVAAVMDTPFEFSLPETSGLLPTSGNVMLAQLLGAELHVIENGPWEELFAHADELAGQYQRAGKRVFQIPVGGSSAHGAYAFFLAAEEVVDAVGEFDWIVTASSSGSTQVGLAHAFRGSRTKVLGVACDPEPEIGSEFAALSAELSKLIGGQPLEAREFNIDFGSVGPGYGIPSDEGNQAIEYLARREGIFLDPIYTGKAFAGLRKQVQEGKVKGRVCFWHTGGTPALFAMG
jgi:D-cysteine desulfhydrase family pyridoxal phosphate-dependent enzyme